MKLLIYGATDTGKRIYQKVKKTDEVIAFIDDNEKQWANTIDGIKIIGVDKIKLFEFDKIIVGVQTYHLEIMEKLIEMKIPLHKIDESYVGLQTYARIACLNNVAQMIYKEEIQGNVAELGVFRGEFAKEINKAFNDRKLYLFDTFEGFSSEDTKIEVEKKYDESDRHGYFGNTSIDLVLSKMVNVQNCVVRAGFFPKTTKGINDRFCFVNLDADLYNPTLEGLRYFYPRMSEGGVIFVHDFFSSVFTGVRDAVYEYCNKRSISFLPIGDSLSIAIRKNTGK